MSSLTRCNRCKVDDIRSTAKQRGWFVSDRWERGWIRYVTYPATANPWECDENGALRWGAGLFAAIPSECRCDPAYPGEPRP